MRTTVKLFAISALALAGTVGCETNTPNSAASQVAVQNNSQSALQAMTSQDGKLQDMINNSYGYVIFPEVGQGAVGVGGSSGTGTVYQSGREVGTVKLTQVSLGPQVGGDTYSELIIFQDQKAMNRLLNDSLEFGASANATIVKAGAAAAARLDNGVGVFILPKGGLMVGANINGQKFHFHGNGQMNNGQMNDNNTRIETTKTDVTNTPPSQSTTETKTTTSTPAPDNGTH